MPDNQSSILFFSANPNGTTNTNNELEYAIIQDIVDRRQEKHGYKLVPHFGVSKETIEDAIIDQGSNHISIVHFSGHGDWEGKLIIEDEELTIYELKELIECKSCEEPLQGIILNACYSAELARDLLDLTPYVIAMSEPISSIDSQIFSKYFYKYLCANTPWKKAFEKSIAKVGNREIVKLLSQSEDEVELKKKAQINEKTQKALWKFDFKDQLNTFFQFKDRPASVCLIHGPAYFGHNWIQKRLLLEALESSSIDMGDKLPLHLNASHTITSVADMLDVLDHGGLYHSSFLNDSSISPLSKTELLNVLKSVLRKRSVIIIIDQADNLCQGNILGDFFTQIWLPICEEINKKPSLHHLLLFCLEKSASSKVTQLIQSHSSSIILPELSYFTPTHVEDWLIEIAVQRDLCKCYEDEQGQRNDEVVKKLFLEANPTESVPGTYQAEPYRFLKALCKKHGQQYFKLVSSSI